MLKLCLSRTKPGPGSGLCSCVCIAIDRWGTQGPLSRALGHDEIQKDLLNLKIICRKGLVIVSWAWAEPSAAQVVGLIDTTAVRRCVSLKQDNQITTSFPSTSHVIFLASCTQLMERMQLLHTSFTHSAVNSCHTLQHLKVIKRLLEKNTHRCGTFKQVRLQHFTIREIRQ